MAKAKPTSHKALSKDRNKTIKFLEELTWLFKTYPDINVSSIRELSNALENYNLSDNNSLGRYVNENPNVMFLVGTLPELLDDGNLFSTNEEISEFASVVLNVVIPRWQKKSRFELIGHIVCNTAKLSDSRVKDVVLALQKLTSGAQRSHSLLELKKTHGRSWNDIIRLLLAQR